MKVYLAGPMTGLPYFNFPAFDEAARALRSIGYDVVSPAELDSPEHRSAALSCPDGDPAAYYYTTAETWGDLLARDVRIIADEGIEAIVVMPGWERSRGARLETFVGSALHHLPVYRMPDGPIASALWERVSAEELAKAWTGSGPFSSGPPSDELDLDDWAALPRDRAHEFDGLVHPEDTGEGTVDDYLSAARGEVRVTNATTGGQKGSKPQRLALLPWDALTVVSEVYGFGADKYEPNNWRKGYDWSLSFDALQRHLAAFWTGEDTDPESSLPHLAHAAFHVLALLAFSRNPGKYGDLDDRWTTTGGED